ncbi:MAG: PaaI family thioesterase [Gammaproteobacteria bacterium]
MELKKYALQDLAAPEGICFGCGSKNMHGLRIKSYWDDDNVHVIATHLPDERYTGWPSLVYGGLISCLIDCHSNWTVMANHYRTEGRDIGTLPRIDCVTGSLGIKYIKPTPMGVLLKLKAHIEGKVERKTRVLCEVYADDILTALGDSVFIRVDIGHLAKTAHSV